MKKITLILSMVFAVISMNAQTIVSTTAENKNVILEEFTGIHCGYCPDGHKISNQIAAANPGDFFAINVHTGGYATPGAGEPDFRTSFGTAIAGQTDLQGYPAGSVNRHVFPGQSQQGGSGSGQGRATWTATSTTAIGEASYVNIAATGSLNIATRIMDVLVEVYVTGTAPATMNLNLAVLQNNVEGPQSSGNTNPDQVLPNGKYNHMHILRHLITGQWGEAIATAGGAGTFISKTYQYTVPYEINGVVMELDDLELVVFLAEGQQEIITGNEGAITLVIPSGAQDCDISIENMTTTPTLCTTSITPTVKITNNSSTITTDTFTVKYSNNGGTDVVKTIYTPLAPGANTTVTFASMNLQKSNDIKFIASFEGVALLYDNTVGNNFVSTGKFYTMPAATIGTIYSEDFESYAGMSKDIDSTVIMNPTNAPAIVISKANVTGLTTDIGGFGNSEKSYFINFFNISAGNSINMIFQKMDFSNNTGYGLSFNYAYAQYSSENDKLEIQVSTDCGATWTTKWSKKGGSLATAPATQNSFFPAPDQWKNANIDLSAYNNTADVMIAFKATSAYGNNLYFDDINIYNSTNVSIETAENTNSVNIYPNPAKDQFNLALDLSENATVNYTVFNNLGQNVLSADLGNLSAGNQNEIVNISNLANGIYVIQLNINNTIITKKLTVK